MKIIFMLMIISFIIKKICISIISGDKEEIIKAHLGYTTTTQIIFILSSIVFTISTVVTVYYLFDKFIF